MILVTGATGHFGTAAIDFLISKGVAPSGIAALVRDEAKATALRDKGVQVRIGNYDEPASLVKAFTGIDKLLLVSSSDLNKRSQQQVNAVNAAKEAGVKYILYTSFARKNDTQSSPIAFIAQSHLDTEKAIKASGIPYTIFRNTLYMDFIPMFIGADAATNGIFLPAGEAGSAVALRAEMAEAAANVLLSNGHEGKEYTIANTSNFSFDDVANGISKVSGKKINYTPSKEEYVSRMNKAGVPDQYVGMFTAFAEAIKQGEFESGKTDLEHLLGRKPGTLSAFLEKTYAA